MTISINEFERRTTVFVKTLPNNPDGLPWTQTEISRVMLKASPNVIYNPALAEHKIDIHHDLRRQFYNDIKLAARAKVAILKRDRALRELKLT